jgi:Glutaminase
MPNPNAIVATVLGVEPPIDRPAGEMLKAEGGLRIELEGERTVRLDPEDSRSAGFAEILDELSKQGLPVYLEVAPATDVVERMRIPRVGRVIGLQPLEGGGLTVQLGYSHALHLLPPDSPDFEPLERGLREALDTGEPVVLTEDDSHLVIDIRAFIPNPEGPVPPLPRPELPWPLPRLPWWIRLWRYIWFWPLWPWWWWFWWRGCVSEDRAQEVFDALSATSCSPLTVPPPCVPFLYPDNGCWARAHEMCRLMVDMGLSPKKVWIRGPGLLHVNTRNNPNCQVHWTYHVAPTLCVRGPWLFWRRRMVIDPSLFATPVTKEEWKGVQGEPNATLTDSDASIYYYWGSYTDPAYTETNYDLATYRQALKLRSLEKGPPPYSHCPY